VKKSKHVWGLVGFVLGTIFGGKVYGYVRRIV
jgi:hypothetical protein